MPWDQPWLASSLAAQNLAPRCCTFCAYLHRLAALQGFGFSTFYPWRPPWKHRVPIRPQCSRFKLQDASRAHCFPQITFKGDLVLSHWRWQLSPNWKPSQNAVFVSNYRGSAILFGQEIPPLLGNPWWKVELQNVRNLTNMHLSYYGIQPELVSL